MTILMSQLMPNGILREFHVRAAYDKRDADPRKNYGVHGVEIEFVVKRSGAAVNCFWMTDWQCQSTLDWWKAAGLDQHTTRFDGLGDLGWHSPIKLDKWDTKISSPCPHTGGDCYYSGTGLGAQELFRKWVEAPDIIWPELEQRLEELESRIQAEQALQRSMG